VAADGTVPRQTLQDYVKRAYADIAVMKCIPGRPTTGVHNSSISYTQVSVQDASYASALPKTSADYLLLWQLRVDT